MRHLNSCILSLVVLSTSLFAQGSVPPYVAKIVDPSQAFWLVTPAIANQIGQVHMVPRYGSVFTAALSVKGLSPAYGGSGGNDWDLLTGTYDAVLDQFIPDTHARGLNTAEREYAMTIHHGGLLAVFDGRTEPILARRPDENAPWALVGPITGLPPQSHYDPALVDVNGQMQLLHVRGNDIAMSPCDVNARRITGPHRVVVTPDQGASVHSPIPITTTSGDLVAVSHHQAMSSSDSDHYCSFDLDPNTPSVLMNDTPTWSNHGGFAAGRFFDAESTTGTSTRAFAMDAYWSTGGRASIGENMEISAYIAPTALPDVHYSVMMLSARFAPTPFPLAACRGLFGLDPSGMVTFDLGPHDNLNGRATVTLQIPNNPTYSGAIIPAQCVTLDFASSVCTLGNTAALTIE